MHHVSCQAEVSNPACAAAGTRLISTSISASNQAQPRSASIVSGVTPGSGSVSGNGPRERCSVCVRRWALCT